MKTILSLIVFFSLATANAAEVKGIKCQTNYVSHEINKFRNYKQDSIVIRPNMIGFGSHSIIGGFLSIVPVDNEVKYFSEEHEDAENHYGIKYTVIVKAEKSSIQINAFSKNDKKDFGVFEFNTNEGITLTQNLLGLLKYSQDKGKITSELTDVIVSCHPVY